MLHIVMLSLGPALPVLLKNVQKHLKALRSQWLINGPKQLNLIMKRSYTIFTLFKPVNGVVRCVECSRDLLPYPESGLHGIVLADYLSTLDLVIDDCLRYALFEADGFKVKLRRFGNSYYIYTTYYE